MTSDNKANNELKGNKSTVKSESSFEKASQNILGGDFLSRKGATKLLPFLLFLTLLGIIYIANIYYAEKNIREIDHIGREIKEIRYEYITTKSTLMHISKRSEISDRLKNTGIKEPVTPPFRLIKTIKK